MPTQQNSKGGGVVCRANGTPERLEPSKFLSVRCVGDNNRLQRRHFFVGRM